MVDRDPIDLLVHRHELTAHVHETDDDDVRVIIERGHPEQVGDFFADLTHGWNISVSTDGQCQNILAYEVIDEEAVRELVE